MMLQFSVYARVCRGEDGAMKHMARVTRNLPERAACGHCRSPTASTGA